MYPNSVTSSLQSPTVQTFSQNEASHLRWLCWTWTCMLSLWNLNWNYVCMYLYLVVYCICIYLFAFVCLFLGWLMLSHCSSGADKQGEVMALSGACIQTAPKSIRILWRSKWNHATSNRKPSGWTSHVLDVSASAEQERAVCRHHHLQLKNVASADELGWLGKWWWW